MRHTTTALLAATLLTAASCAPDTTPDLPTVEDATTTCIDQLTKASEDVTVEDTTTTGEHAWTITGRAGDHPFTCQVTYTGGGVRTDVHVETEPRLDQPRHVGDVNGVSVYAAQGTPDQPRCILIVLGTTEATSCTTEEDFARRGVTIRLDHSDGDSVAATLLPDEFTGQLEDGWEILGPNLAAPSDPG
jgi:hypothetical protein